MTKGNRWKRGDRYKLVSVGGSIASDIDKGLEVRRAIGIGLSLGDHSDNDDPASQASILYKKKSERKRQ